MQSQCLVNQKNKMKIKSRVQYYSNYIARYRTILSGEIEIDKVPCLSKSKSQVCDKTIIKKTVVRYTQKCLVCEHFLANVSCQMLQSLNQNTSNKAYEWTCPNCIHTALAFYNRRKLDFDSTVAEETTAYK